MKKTGRQKNKETTMVALAWRKAHPGRDDTRLDIGVKSKQLLEYFGIVADGGKNELRDRAFAELMARKPTDPAKRMVATNRPIKTAAPLSKTRKKVRVRSDLPDTPPPPSKAMKEAFYSSWEWTALRMQVLKEQGRRCLCCGAAAGDDMGGGVQARIVVDHIKPLSLHWDMRLDRSNLQVLCHVCNQGKSNVHEDDFRAA